MKVWECKIVVSDIAGHYIYIKTCENKLYPWIPQQKEILSNDWVIVKDDDEIS